MKKFLFIFALLALISFVSADIADAQSKRYCHKSSTECFEITDPTTFNTCRDTAPEGAISFTPCEGDGTGGSDVSGSSGDIRKQAAGLNPMNISGPSDLFANAINIMMAFIGSIAILLYIYAGFLWMSAAGNADRVGQAKTILIWTTFGAIAMAASYMIVKTVLTKVG